MNSLVVQHVSKEYPTTAGSSLQILADVSFTVATGESLAVLGPSGSGKSTLLAILGTLDQPTTGTLSLNDVHPAQLPEVELAQFRSHQIGFVFQDHHLLPQCTVLENVLIPFLANGQAGPEEVAAAEQLLKRVGLADRSQHRPAQLSGGEKQRAAIARALVRQPTLLLADEPTGNLDHQTANEVVDLLLELQTEQNSILITATHSTTLAQRLQQRAELDTGKLCPIA